MPHQSHRLGSPTDSRRIELSLRTSEGNWIEVGDLQSAPILLFLFTTFDPISHAALQPLGQVVQKRSTLHVVGIAIQPDPRQLIQAFRESLDPPFPLAYDPRGQILSGNSPLGTLQGVPAFIMLNSSGRVVRRWWGFASEEELLELVDQAD